ncbi:MAG: hypothetical protein IPN54_01635 [Bacteroidetes bacterium]|nr:hypothetical protein [Bacteroidota bacterium]
MFNRDIEAFFIFMITKADDKTPNNNPVRALKTKMPPDANPCPLAEPVINV